MLQASLEAFGVRGAPHAHRLSHPVKAYRGYERGALAAVPGYLAVGSLSFRSPRAQSIHRDMRAALVHESLAALLEGEVGVGLQMPGRPIPTPQSSAYSTPGI